MPYRCCVDNLAFLCPWHRHPSHMTLLTVTHRTTTNRTTTDRPTTDRTRACCSHPVQGGSPSTWPLGHPKARLGSWRLCRCTSSTTPWGSLFLTRYLVVTYRISCALLAYFEVCIYIPRYLALVVVLLYNCFTKYLPHRFIYIYMYTDDCKMYRCISSAVANLYYSLKAWPAPLPPRSLSLALSILPLGCPLCLPRTALVSRFIAVFVAGSAAWPGAPYSRRAGQTLPSGRACPTTQSCWWGCRSRQPPGLEC